MTLIGCSNSPDRVYLPQYDPDASGEAALEACDTNGDGLVSKDESKSCPGILAAFRTFDRDQDDLVSAEEIANRIRDYIDNGAGLIQVSCKVFLNGKPLSGALVELVPEAFLGEVVETASGTSRKGGYVPLKIPPDNLPEDLAGVPGVRQGVYRVKVTHPDHKLPDRYASGNGLGVEIVPSRATLFLRLKSK